MIGFPLLLIPLAIYNMIAFLTPGVQLDRPALHRSAEVGRRMVADARATRSSCSRC